MARNLTSGLVTVRDQHDETFYDNSPTSQGTFSGGTGHAASDVITVTGGTTVLVDTVSSGVVTEFTLTSTADTGGHVATDVLSQTGTTGSGASFSLTLDSANLSPEANYPYSKYGLVQRCTLSAGATGQATWGIHFAPSADTEYHLVEDYIARDIVFVSAAQSPAADGNVEGRWLTSTEHTYQGTGTSNTASSQDLNNVVALTPNYIDQTAVPTPTAPR